MQVLKTATTWDVYHGAVPEIEATVLLWIAVLLLCLLEPGCLAMDAAAAAAETDPAVTWLAAVGAGWLTWRGMVLVLKLDEPGRKRGVRR